MCVSAQNFPFLEERPSCWFFCKDPFPQYVHIHSFWDLGLKSIPTQTQTQARVLPLPVETDKPIPRNTRKGQGPRIANTTSRRGRRFRTRCLTPSSPPSGAIQDGTIRVCRTWTCESEWSPEAHARPFPATRFQSRSSGRRGGLSCWGLREGDIRCPHHTETNSRYSSGVRTCLYPFIRHGHVSWRL